MHCGYMNVIISENIIQSSVVNTLLCTDMQVVFPGHPHILDLCSESLSLLHVVPRHITSF